MANQKKSKKHKKLKAARFTRYLRIKSNDGYDISQKGGITLAVKFDYIDRKVTYGYAICSLDDAFNSKAGSELAHERLYNNENVITGDIDTTMPTISHFIELASRPEEFTGSDLHTGLVNWVHKVFDKYVAHDYTNIRNTIRPILLASCIQPPKPKPKPVVACSPQLAGAIQLSGNLLRAFIHASSKKIYHTRLLKGGLTIISYRKDNLITYSLSSCSMKDQFNKKIGIQRAMDSSDPMTTIAFTCDDGTTPLQAILKSIICNLKYPMYVRAYAYAFSWEHMDGDVMQLFNERECRMYLTSDITSRASKLLKQQH